MAPEVSPDERADVVLGVSIPGASVFLGAVELAYRGVSRPFALHAQPLS